MHSHHHSTADRHALRSTGALLLCILLLALGAPIAMAGEPHVVRPPAPSRDAPTPHFVTETNDTKWDDCEWASAAMLIEKWTGDRVDRRELRAAANVKKGGSSLRDVARGMDALLDLHLRYSPNGGDPMTWRQLLARLADGGGAVIEGAYSRFPRWFQRWDRKFAASGSVKSAHAVYIERYEPRRHRVWLMDPLGRDGYNGEWISLAALRYYAYTSGGLVRAAATPARLPPVPLSRVRFGQPAFAGAVHSGSPAALVVPISRYGKKAPTLAPLWISTAWEKVDAALPDGPVAAAPRVGSTSGVAMPPPSTSAPTAGLQGASPAGTPGTSRTPPPIVTGGPKGTVLSASGWNLVAHVIVPTEPGRYRLTMTLRTAAGKAIGPPTVLPFMPIVVSVQGPYGVTFEAPARLPMAHDGLSFGVTNAGSAPWVATPSAGDPRVGGPLATTPHIVVDWLMADGSTMGVETVYLDLDPGETAGVSLPLPRVPVGAIALRLDLTGPDGRRISEAGGRPTLIPISRAGSSVPDPR